jgi:RecB family exonuclease
MDAAAFQGSRLITASGTRALEARLLGELAAVLPRRPEELEPPVRIIVPSQSLRRHLSSRLVEWRGRAMVGIVVQTLYAAALEICERMGERLQVMDAPYELLVRRLAGQEKAFRSGLGHLEDGYATVAATVRDLFDAGFEPWHAEPLREQLTDLARGPVPTQVLERATALVRVAEQAAELAAELGIARTSDLLRQATELVAGDPDRALPARMVYFHGYVDATGAVVDLIETLIRIKTSAVLIDLPPDPADPGRVDSGASFAQRLLERLSGVARRESEETGDEPGSFSASAAPTREAEVRHAATMVRGLIDEGTAPELISIVVRDLPRYASLIRRHLDRLGVPYSAVGGQVVSGPGRRLAQALVALLRKRRQTPVDLWLTAGSAGLDQCQLADIRLGLRRLGVARLDDLAELKVDRYRNGVRLPFVTGLEGSGRHEQLQYRKLSFESLDAAVQAARACLDLLSSWPDPAPAEQHLQQTRQVLTSLGWGADASATALHTAMVTAARDLPSTWAVSREEWLQSLAVVLGRAVTTPLGGAGGGVQVLSVMEARARTSVHLFLLGLNRDIFPRVVREDPLLPDTLRGRISLILPDIPIKARGWAEERYLFAQLLSSALDVHLSWCRSESGQPLAPSPFVERLKLGGRLAVNDSPGLWLTPGPGASEQARPALEHVVSAGLAGDRDTWAAALAVAVDEGRGRCSLGPAAPAAVTARQTLLEEVDPRRRRIELSPFAGGTGHQVSSSHLLRVTRLEQIARCPWQAFVTRILGLAASPDPQIELPGTDPRLVGILVHKVLQAIVDEAAGKAGADLFQAMLRLPVATPWPAASHLEALLAKLASEVTSHEGLARPGTDLMLAEVVRPFLEVARQSEWGGGGEPVPAVGAEVEGRLQVGAYSLLFRADRVDSDMDGPCLVDYKTGRNPVANRKREESRRKHLLRMINQGQMLQAVVYTLAAGGRGARGRYLYLQPDDDIDDQARRQLVVSGDDQEVMAAFEQAIESLIMAIESGAYFPRVEEPGTGKESSWCRSCAVRETCLRNDSGFRRRLVAWMEEQRPGSAGAGDSGTAAAAAAGLWWLGVTDA